MRKWWHWALLFIGIIVLLRIPATRDAIFWLLPLGSGFDDLIEIVALVLLAVILFAKGWTSIPRWLQRK